MTTEVHFCVARWSLWTPRAPGVLAEVPEVPSLLRRRAGASDRAALRVAFDCVGADDRVPAIFCSRHGEVARSVELLDQLKRQEAPSPTVFSLSVHNAAAAVFSIARGDTSPTSSISAGQNTLPSGVQEAALRLLEGNERVLVVTYEDELPKRFQPYQDENHGVFALGMLLTRTGAQEYSLELSEGTEPASETPHAILLAEFLRREDLALTVPAAPRRWTWRQHA